jgi:hypothetical protein
MNIIYSKVKRKTKIKLSKFMKDQDIDELVTKMESNEIRYLALDGFYENTRCPRITDIFRRIKDAMQKNTSITEISLNGIYLDFNISEFLGSLKNNITDFNLIGSPISTEELIEFSNVIGLSKKLVTFSISMPRKILLREIKALANGLKENKCLTRLSLSKNEITDKGVKVLVDALKDAKNLIHLDLSENKITDNGATEIAAALKGNTKLTDLNLNGNRLEAIGVSLLSELKNTTSITSLNVLSQREVNREEEKEEKEKEEKEEKEKEEEEKERLDLPENKKDIVQHNIRRNCSTRSKIMVKKHQEFNNSKMNTSDYNNFLSNLNDVNIINQISQNVPFTKNNSETKQDGFDSNEKKLGQLNNYKKNKKSNTKNKEENKPIYYLNPKYTNKNNIKTSTHNEMSSLEESIKMNSLTFKTFKTQISDEILDVELHKIELNRIVKIISEISLDKFMPSADKIYLIHAGRISYGKILLPPQRANDITFLIVTNEEYRELLGFSSIILKGLIGEGRNQNIALCVYDEHPGIVSRRRFGLVLMEYLNRVFKKQQFFSLDDNIQSIAINTKQITLGINATEDAYHQVIDEKINELDTGNSGTIFSLSGLDYRKVNTEHSSGVGSKFTYFNFKKSEVLKDLLLAYQFFPNNFAQQDYFIHFALTTVYDFNTMSVLPNEISWKRSNNDNLSGEANKCNLMFEDSYLDIKILASIFYRIENSEIIDDQKSSYKKLYQNFFSMLRTSYNRLLQNSTAVENIDTGKPSKKQKTDNFSGGSIYNRDEILNNLDGNKYFSYTGTSTGIEISEIIPETKIFPPIEKADEKKIRSQGDLSIDEIKGFNCAVYVFRNNNKEQKKYVHIENLTAFSKDFNIGVNIYLTILPSVEFDGSTFNQTINSTTEIKKSIDILGYVYDNKIAYMNRRITSKK